MSNKQVFNLLPPFGKRSSVENISQYARYGDIEIEVSKDDVFKSMLAIPVFSNTGLAIRSFFRDFSQARPGVLNKREKETNIFQQKGLRGDWYEKMDIPHPKFFHRRIIGH